MPGTKDGKFWAERAQRPEVLGTAFCILTVVAAAMTVLVLTSTEAMSLTVIALDTSDFKVHICFTMKKLERATGGKEAVDGEEAEGLPRLPLPDTEHAHPASVRR